MHAQALCERLLGVAVLPHEPQRAALEVERVGVAWRRLERAVTVGQRVLEAPGAGVEQRQPGPRTVAQQRVPVGDGVQQAVGLLPLACVEQARRAAQLGCVGVLAGRCLLEGRLGLRQVAGRVSDTAAQVARLARRQRAGPLEVTDGEQAADDRAQHAAALQFVLHAAERLLGSLGRRERRHRAAAGPVELGEGRVGPRVGRGVVRSQGQLALGFDPEAEPRADHAEAHLPERVCLVVAGRALEQLDLLAEVAHRPQDLLHDAAAAEGLPGHLQVVLSLLEGLLVDPRLGARLLEQPLDQREAVALTAGVARRHSAHAPGHLVAQGVCDAIPRHGLQTGPVAERLGPTELALAQTEHAEAYFHAGEVGALLQLERVDPVRGLEHAVERLAEALQVEAVVEPRGLLLGHRPDAHVLRIGAAGLPAALGIPRASELDRRELGAVDAEQPRVPEVRPRIQGKAADAQRRARRERQLPRRQRLGLAGLGEEVTAHDRLSVGVHQRSLAEHRCLVFERGRVVPRHEPLDRQAVARAPGRHQDDEDQQHLFLAHAHLSSSWATNANPETVAFTVAPSPARAGSVTVRLSSTRVRPG